MGECNPNGSQNHRFKSTTINHIQLEKQISYATIGSINFDLSIIATPATNRISILNKIEGISKSIICEKLICSNGSDLYGWYNIANSANSLYSTGKWEVTNLKSSMNSLSEQHKLGNLKSIFISGGHCCLSTGGSHWISFFLSLLDTDDFELSFNCNTHDFNPRSDALKTLSGFIHIHSCNLSFTINFDFGSHVPASALFNYQFGKLSVDMFGHANVMFYKNKPSFRHEAHYIANDASRSFSIEDSENHLEKNIINVINNCGVNILNGLRASEILIYAAMSSNNKNLSKNITFSNLREKVKNHGEVHLT